MAQAARLFKVEQAGRPTARWADTVVLIALGALIYVGVYLALDAPAEIRGPTISLSPAALPWYTGLSVARMAAAYALSMLFSIAYGYGAARSRRAERVLLPLLDVLQSVPILSFLPVVLLSLSAVLPTTWAAELASVILIFTSQAWNLTFAWYQSLGAIPKELKEASQVFRVNGWLRFRLLELPFAAINLIWNSMMSWAGGWFFLMAAETFAVGHRDFRLPGLGAYLQAAASCGNLHALALGLATLVAVITALDQLVWSPLLAWSDRFKLEMVESENPPTSWFYSALSESRLSRSIARRIFGPALEHFDAWTLRRFPVCARWPAEGEAPRWTSVLGAGVVLAAAAYGAFRAAQTLLQVPLIEWGSIALGVGTTLLRVATALVLALAWTIPVGVLIGTKPRWAAWLQPVVQVAASVPATALFPVLLLALAGLPGGVNLAAVLLMLLGTQWYLLFNIIAGASVIPQDLRNTAVLLQLRPWQRWRTLTLPALFPYVVTGAVTASGGAWNASIVAEHLDFGGRTLHTAGVGALIATAGAEGNYPLLLAATLSMIVTVVLINRLVWRRMYRIAEERYRME